MRGPSRTMAPMNSLSMREASTKYGVPLATLWAWVGAGLIRTVSEPEKRGQPKLIAEPDVAMLAATYEPGKKTRRAKRLAGALANPG